MNIEYLKTEDLIPYNKNAKRHPSDQVKKIAESIKQFGFQQPIVVDKDNVVVIGHGRLLASKRLKLSEVPVVRADELTDEQIKALRLADNKVSESKWNDSFLKIELDDIADIDMSDFGFDLDFGDDDQDNKDDDDNSNIFGDHIRSAFTQNVFENQERRQFTADNYYGIPSMFPTQTTGDKMLRFCDWNEVEDPENYIAHFYYDDVKFMQAWRNPDKYVDKLRKFKAVVSPNFSLYTDFPRILQILSCYRRQWVGAYWQEKGLDVIPNVVWGDHKSYDYCFLGIPEDSVVSVSSVDIMNNDDWNGKKGDLFRDGYNEMMKRLHPSAIIYYGNLFDGLDGNIIKCPSYYEQKRAMLNKQKEVKDGKR